MLPFQVICWLEFLAVAKDLFRGAYQFRGSSWVAQVELQENGTGRVYYFNKGTGETSWAPFPPEEKETEPTKSAGDGSLMQQLRELMALRDNGDLVRLVQQCAAACL